MADTSQYITSVFEWLSVNGNPSLNFVVLQTGNYVRFYDTSNPLLSSGYIDQVDISSYIISATSLATPISFSSGNGLLFAVNERMEPIYITYDPEHTLSSSDFFITQFSVKIRDMLGVDDGLEVSERPRTLSTTHKYNLWNQGWPNYTVHCTDSAKAYNGSYTDCLTNTYHHHGIYPSNSDMYSALKCTSADESDKIGSYHSWALKKVFFGSTPAPKGHFVIDAFNLNRSEVSGLAVSSASFIDSVSYNRPSTTTFFSGRVWLSGIPSSSLVGRIFFSQVIKSNEDIEKYYQEQDPTAEELNALLATDGGVIRILDAGKIVSLKTLGKGVVVIATNGVWFISGTSNSGFSAEDFEVSKITNTGTTYASSVVEADNKIFFWSYAGIVEVSINETGAVQAQQITDLTIKNSYIAINGRSKSACKACYDHKDSKIIWLYSSDQTVLDTYASKCTDALIYDLRLNAFYDYQFAEIPEGNCYVVEAITPKNITATTISTVSVMSGADTIVVGADFVVADEVIQSNESILLSTKYVTFYNNDQIGFSEMTNDSFVDWSNVDGVGMSYDSYVVTGHENLGDSQRRKFTVYVTTHFNKTEENFYLNDSDQMVLDKQSACTMQSRWDYSNSEASNKFSPEYEIYRLRRYTTPVSPGTFDYGYSVVSTKNKVRGTGKALSLKFSSVPGKDFQLLGWEIQYEVNKKV